MGEWSMMETLAIEQHYTGGKHEDIEVWLEPGNSYTPGVVPLCWVPMGTSDSLTNYVKNSSISDLRIYSLKLTSTEFKILFQVYNQSIQTTSNYLLSIDNPTYCEDPVIQESMAAMVWMNHWYVMNLMNR